MILTCLGVYSIKCFLQGHHLYNEGDEDSEVSPSDGGNTRQSTEVPNKSEEEREDDGKDDEKEGEEDEDNGNDDDDDELETGGSDDDKDAGDDPSIPDDLSTDSEKDIGEVYKNIEIDSIDRDHEDVEDVYKNFEIDPMGGADHGAENHYDAEDVDDDDVRRSEVMTPFSSISLFYFLLHFSRSLELIVIFNLLLFKNHFNANAKLLVRI